ncbi:hypothetical protein ACKKBG_A37395 [Auxenochlorella protothecoides x Auxenochlorella symbiontica]
MPADLRLRENKKADNSLLISGTTFTAVGHTITSVIGAGILNLPYAVSILGWVAGPVCLLIFSFITQYTSQLLADCGVIRGVRQRTYTDVVEATFGRRGYVIIAWVQHSNLILVTLAFQITGALSMQTVATSVCKIHGITNCLSSYWVWAVVFAGLQLLLIQMPDLSYFWWASLVGATMSFCYSTIALGLSIAQGNTYGTVGGQPLEPAAKAFGVLNALGSIVFAYSFSMILIEIQDTIKGTQKAGPIQSMQIAVKISVASMTFFYLAVATAGYLAFGNDVPAYLLTGFEHPRWLILTANIMVVVHMLPAYQVYAQPFVVFVEFHYAQWARAPRMLRGVTFRILFRSAFVVLLGVLGMCLPFFGDIVGLVGAIGFWPATVYYPIECWIRVYKPSERRKFWLRVLNIACFVVTLAATVGSVQLIIVDSNSYTVFSNR